MKHEKLAEALNEINDNFIAEAATVKKRRKFFPLAAVAAILVIVIVWWSVGSPIITAKAISLADYDNAYRPGFGEAAACGDALASFFVSSISQVLSGSGEENKAFSPMNLYMALAVTAELSGGDGQILSLLGAESLDVLREQANLVWNATYQDSNNPCLLANSLWLDNDLSYEQATMDILADHYFTSVYQGNFGSAATNWAIASWLNGQTKNLLRDASDNISLNPETVFALYATIYFQAKWNKEFSASWNTEELFHAPGGDVTCTYMNKQKTQGMYYWGDSFGAITLSLKNGSQMWLILPDEGKSVDDVLASVDLSKTLFGTENAGEQENSKAVFINLSLPKFDIRSSGDLKDDLRQMGVTDVFDREKADFNAILRTEGEVWLSAVNQATRVCIDEKGVTAASYIEIPAAGAAAPPDDTIDFILDRPFLFVVTNHYGLPLFAGVVNQP